jgi:hypothetical protein
MCGLPAESVWSPADATLIDGVHDYCDRCCWRCPLSARCRYYLESAGQVSAPWFTHSLQVPPELKHDPLCADTLCDPLVVRATNYGTASTAIIRALRPLLSDWAERRVSLAIDRIDETALAIGGKDFRAVLGSLQLDCDPGDVQTDANGSAKVARLLIEESRRAWMELLEPGRLVAEGVPGRFVVVLNELEATLADRFPRALEFVRPGFDTDARETVLGAVNRAVCQLRVPCGHA